MLTKNKSKRIKTPSRIKSILLLILISVSTIVALPIFQPTTANAVNKQALMSPADQIKSHIYLYAMGYCMKNSLFSGLSRDTTVIGPLHPYRSISDSNAQAGNWWWNKGNWGDSILPLNWLVNNTSTYVGPYMAGAGGDIAGIRNNGEVDCYSPDLVMGAMTLWGLDPVEVLCNSGFERQDYADNTGSAADIQNCINDGSGGRTDAFESATGHQGSNANNYTVMANDFMNYITAQVGNADLTKAQQYIYYQHTLNQSCIEGIDTTEPDKNTATGDSAYNGAKWVDTSSDPMKILQTDNAKSSYDGKMKLSDSVNFSISTSLGKVKMKCEDVFKQMNKFAPDFLIWAKLNPDEARNMQAGLQANGPGANGKPTCGSAVTGLGWLICPVINAVVGLNDTMWSLVQGLLTVSPLQQNKPIYDAWGGIRSLANAIFVIFFMVIIFSQLTGAGITNYGIKKMLPKIIVAAILVNVSFIIVQGAVDLSNIIGSSLYKMIEAMIPNTGQSTWSMLLNSISTIGFTTVGVGVGVALVAGSATGFWMLVPFLLMGLLGLVAAFLTLAFRQAAIPILAILAPLAFVAYLLPNTESWFKKWRGLLMSMLMLYPLAAVIFAGSQFASVIIIGDKSSFLNFLIGMTVLALPLFSLPFLARQGGAIQGKVAGALNGLVQRARPGISSYAKERADAARAAYQNDTRAPARTGAGRLYRRFSPRNVNRSIAAQKMERENKTEENKELFKHQVATNQVNRAFGSEGERTIDGARSKATLATAKRYGKIDEKEAAATSLLMNQNGINKEEELTNKRHEFAENRNTKELHQPDAELDAARIKADHSKGRAETATNDAKKRVEQAEGTLQVRARTKNSAEALENTEAHTKSVIEAASTKINPNNPDITPVEKEALGIGIDTRAELTSNKAERKIEASATGQAVAAQNQEIADVFLSSSAPDSAAVRAAGVAGAAGVARVQASATSELAKFRQDNVNAAMTLFADQGYSSDPSVRGKSPDEYSDLLKVATGGRLRSTKVTDPITGVETTLPGAEPAEEQQEAAMQLIFNTGSADAISTIYDRLAKLPDGSDAINATPEEKQQRRTKLKLEQSFSRIASAGKRPKSIRGGIIGKLSSGDVGPDSTVVGLDNLTPFQSIAFEILTKGKLAAESFAETDQEELRIWAETLTLPGVRDRFSFNDPGKPDSGTDPDRKVETSIVNAITSALTNPLVAKDVKHEQRTQMNDILRAFGRNPIEEQEKGIAGA